ncbi:E3 ubiquitin-protein ligase NEURL3 [Xenopus tropicalis]|uniref:E3 ubiquitin-protein ligase NEURL3 n=1 Tax=Xenopus tropicalis TaxID=8364 RepID=A0A6I8Q4X4_XENTR|nr:E3 ubiquitin-protein ligase NEURL3 [Xenopus tropicalis]|eukprot:XP_002932612.2 PREDICTED: E3 ubiquitin-protein ligase NEURL3 [Xenopus tropicalis]
MKINREHMDDLLHRQQCSMGGCLSSETEGLSFHPYTKGCHITLNSCLHQAERQQSFHHGIIFSNRPLLSKEKLWIRVLKEEERWHGALRIGYTSVDPSTLEPCCLPPFVCPDLTNLPRFWGVGIPEELCQAGALIKFWFSKNGKVFCQREGEPCARVLFSGIPKNTKLWAMLDVYGKTKAIQVMGGPSQKNPTPPCQCQCQSQINKDPQPLGSGHSLEEIAEQTAIPTANLNSCNDTTTWHSQKNFHIFLEDDPSCVICQDRKANTLLLPCGHCTFCQSCVEKLQGHSQSCPLCRQRIHSAQYIGCGNSIPNPIT